MSVTSATVSTATAYFETTGDNTFDPTPAAGGHWGPALISGPAVAGLAAYALERDHDQSGFLPARFTIDLVKPARQAPTRVQTRLVRDGRRVRYTECDVLQGDWIVARATAVQYRKSEAPPGAEWTPVNSFPRPHGSGVDRLVVGSDSAGWSVLGANHQDGSRKRACYRGVNVLQDEPVSPFVRSVIVAEAAANLVINLGTKGIGYINGDLTVSLSRLPRCELIGVQGDTRSAFDGIAVGTASLFDDLGPFGSAMVTSLANPDAQIDFAGTARTAAPGAELFDHTGS